MAMVKDVMYGKTLRKSYAKHDDDRILEIPNLLKIQKDSYERFLAEGLNGSSRTSTPSPTTPETWS